MGHFSSNNCRNHFEPRIDVPAGPTSSFGVGDIFTYTSDGSTWHYGLPTPSTPQSDIWALGCIGYEIYIDQQFSVYAVESTPKIDSYGGDSRNLTIPVRENTRLDRHLRGWREYDVDNILASTVSLTSSLEHLHKNDRDLDATSSQTENLGLPTFNY